MLNFLNSNSGLISFIELVVTIIIAVIGFIINKNINSIKQKQSIGDNSKGLQAGGDVRDTSQKIGDYSSHNKQQNGQS